MPTTNCYNLHRWYDSGTGRYTASDPTGLHAAGGLGPLNLLYGYAESAPTAHFDPLGLLAFGGSCTQPQIDALNNAENDINNTFKENPDCLPCKMMEDAKKKLKTATAHCMDWTSQGILQIPEDKCAWAGDPDRRETGADITFFEPAFGDHPCGGCLPGLLLHEILHLVPSCGGGDCALDNAKNCYPCHTANRTRCIGFARMRLCWVG